MVDDGVAWAAPVDDRWPVDCGTDADGGGAGAEPDAGPDGDAGGAAGIVGGLLSGVTSAASRSPQTEQRGKDAREGEGR